MQEENLCGGLAWDRAALNLRYQLFSILIPIQLAFFIYRKIAVFPRSIGSSSEFKCANIRRGAVVGQTHVNTGIHGWAIRFQMEIASSWVHEQRIAVYRMIIIYTCTDRGRIMIEVVTDNEMA